MKVVGRFPHVLKNKTKLEIWLVLRTKHIANKITCTLFSISSKIIFSRAKIVTLYSDV